MILMQTQKEVPDFLRDLGFVAPKGYTLQSITAPSAPAEDTDKTLQADFVKQETPNNNVQYTKKDLSRTFSFSDVKSANAPQVAESFPKHSPAPAYPAASRPELIKAYAPLKETAIGKYFILKESICGLPKNTVLFYKKVEEQL